MQSQKGIYLTLGVVTSLSLGGILGACSSLKKPEIKTVAQPNEELTHPGLSGGWSSRMQELSQALNRLLPLVASSHEFNNPANEASIQDAASRLKSLSHQVRDSEKPTPDPAFDSIARMLDDDMARAVSALASGNRDYARLTIRESIGYCIQCHTQTSGGPDFPKLELSYNPSKLSPLAQGDFFAATRQFDRALNAYSKGVRDNQYAKKDIFGWERAARSALAIAVRYKESPQSAKGIALAVQTNNSAPESLKTASRSWLRSIKEWQSQNKKSLSPDDQLKLAKKLIVEASQKENIEDPQDIPYLRASAILHKWLSSQPLQIKKPDIKRADALLLAGQAAEASRELNFWTLHERYYELCIDDAPQTVTAQTCYKLLSDSIITGYTGSSGTKLPSSEQLRLAKLKEKAFGGTERR